MNISNPKNVSINFNYDSLKSLDGIEHFNFETESGTINRELVRKVAHFIANNPLTKIEPLQKKTVVSRLNKKINQTKSETKGFIAFFRYLFRGKLKAFKIEEREICERLKAIIEKLPEENRKVQDFNKKASQLKNDNSQTEKKENEMPKNTDSKIGSDSIEVIKNDESKDSHIPPSPVSFTPPSEPDPDESTDNKTPPPSPLNESTDNKTPPPPPPPPLSKKSTSPKSEKEKWDEKEQNRLEKEFQKRADPNSYYSRIPPKEPELSALKERKKTCETVISVQRNLLDSFTTDNPTDNEKKLKTQIESIQKSYEDKLNQVLEEIEGKKTVMKSSYHGNQRELSPQLAQVLNNLTNEELKIIIGIAYKGEKPSDNYYNTQKPNVQGYIDEILNDWQNISNSTVATAFIKNKKGWEDLLKKNQFDFIHTYIERMTSGNAGPKHAKRPYSERNKPVVLPKQNIGGQGLPITQDELEKRLQGLKKQTPPPHPPPPLNNSLPSENKENNMKYLQDELGKKFRHNKSKK